MTIPLLLSAVLSVGATAALAQEETTTTTTSERVEATQVDDPFPEDLALVLIVAALVIVAGLVLVIRRVRRS